MKLLVILIFCVTVAMAVTILPELEAVDESENMIEAFPTEDPMMSGYEPIRNHPSRSETRRTNPSSHIICHWSTPCRWDTYIKEIKRVEHEIINTYCVCADNEDCIPVYDDRQAYAYTYYCRDATVEPIELD